MRGIPELRIDPRLELLRQRVLEELGFRVHFVQREAEPIDEIPLEEPVVAKHLEGTTLARLGQLDSSIGSSLHEPELCQPLGHRCRRRSADPELPREGGGRDALTHGLERVDRFEVVLDGRRELCVGRLHVSGS